MTPVRRAPPRPPAPIGGRPRGTRTPSTRRRTTCDRSLDRRQRQLRVGGTAVDAWMVIREGGDHVARRPLWIERDEHGALGLEVLQPVHPVGQGDLAGALVKITPGPQVVPAGPHVPPPGHQRWVPVEYRVILLEPARAEQRALGIARVGAQDRQGRVGVCREHHLIHEGDLTARIGDPHAVGPALDPRHGRPRMRSRAQGPGDAFDVGATATAHGAPARPLAELQQPVVVEEAHEHLGGIAEHLVESRRPDAGDLGQQEIFDEPPRIALPSEVGAGRFARARVQQRRRLTAESQDVADHVPVASVQQVRGLGEQAQPPGPIFERPLIDRDGERHVARLGRYPECREQMHEVRVVALVVDDEAGVDRQPPFAVIDLDAVGVASEPSLGLVQGHVMARVERPGSAQACDPRTDHRDPHVVAPSRP